MGVLALLGAQSRVGKKWDSVVVCLADHAKFLLSHTTLLGSYTGITSPPIEHTLVEAIMVSVNSVNECPYCDGLHGNLARMAGVEDAEKLRASQKSAQDSVPAVVFAKAFAASDGRGGAALSAYTALVAAEGEGRAASIKALALFLMWGSLVGNSVNCAKKQLLGGAGSGLTALALGLLGYYSPLFLLVHVVNMLLSVAPTMASQAWFFKLMGVVLWTLSMLWIAPVGLLGIGLSIVVPGVSVSSRAMI